METGVCKMSESRTIKKKQGINGKTNKNNLNNGFKNLFLRRLFKRQKYFFCLCGIQIFAALRAQFLVVQLIQPLENFVNRPFYRFESYKMSKSKI